MYRVMIVDDMPIFRRQIKRLPLWGNSTGFEIVDEASDGLEALQKLRNQSLDLLISDIRMLILDGLELLKCVQKENLVPCVVFLSDYGEFGLAKEAIHHGIFDYLLKPVDERLLAALLSRVQKHLESLEARDAEVNLLKTSLAETVAPYYPNGQIREIIESLTSQRAKASELFQDMIRKTYLALDLNVFKTRAILEKSCQEICSKLVESLDWLPLFLNNRDLMLFDYETEMHVDLSDQDAFETLFRIVKIRFEKLVEILNILDPWDQGHTLIRKIKEFILTHCEAVASQEEIAKEFYLTKNYIAETFRRETGITLGDYITKVKLYRALELMADSALKTYEIAELLGYSDEYFYKLFRRQFGMTPSQYRQKNTRKLSG